MASTDTPPAGALAAAKAYLRIETTGEDDLLATLVVAAIGIAEGFLGGRLIGAGGLAADWPSLPAAIRQGVVRLAAHLHSHRDGADDAGPPAAVAALWRPFRTVRLGVAS